MDVLHTVTVNDSTFKVTNPTDYYLDQYLDSQYGFELYYKNKRGMQQARWLTMLEVNGFDEPTNMGKGLYQAETHADTLDFHLFVRRPFVLYWVFSDVWYGLGFDGNEFIMQDESDMRWLPSLIL